MESGINYEQLVNTIRDIIRQELAALEANPPQPKELLTMEEAAELIRMSPSTFYKNLINKGKIIQIKRGGKKVIKRADLIGWVNASAVPPKKGF